MALTVERKIPALCLYLCAAICAQEPLRITARPGIYTNHFGLLNIGRSRVSIILFDLLNMRPADSASGRQQLLKFLREEVRPDDRIGIYTLSSQLRVLHDFTEDTRDPD